MRNISYDDYNREFYYGDIVEVYYDITVKAEGDDDPDNPDNPDDPTANEEVDAAHPVVYTQGHTIYVRDAVGEVEVYSVVGQRIYKGMNRAIAVNVPGIYMVCVGDYRCKVLVR